MSPGRRIVVSGVLALAVLGALAAGIAWYAGPMVFVGAPPAPTTTSADPDESARTHRIQLLERQIDQLRSQLSGSRDEQESAAAQLDRLRRDLQDARERVDTLQRRAAGAAAGNQPERTGQSDGQ